jgi:hypothetical protein
MVNLQLQLLKVAFHVTWIQGWNLRGGAPPQNTNHPDWQGNQNEKNSNKIK